MGMSGGSAMAAVLTAALSLSYSAPAAARQKPAARPEFEVATVEPAAPGAVSSPIRVTSGQRLSAEASNLRQLIIFAYHLNPRQLDGGSGWMRSDRWAIQARGPAGPPLAGTRNLEQVQLMLQSLLADRFHLVMHSEDRELDHYSLTVAKGGLRLTPDETGVAPSQAGRGGSPGAGGIPGAPTMPGALTWIPGRMVGRACPISALTGGLSNILLSLVIDNTGLTDTYDIDLNWTPGPGEMAYDPQSAEVPGPSLFDALEKQLGLKLQASKGPVPVQVIDQAEIPSGN